MNNDCYFTTKDGVKYGFDFGPILDFSMEPSVFITSYKHPKYIRSYHYLIHNHIIDWGMSDLPAELTRYIDKVLKFKVFL
jgi:hypothetical protein